MGDASVPFSTNSHDSTTRSATSNEAPYRSLRAKPRLAEDEFGLRVPADDGSEPVRLELTFRDQDVADQLCASEACKPCLIPDELTLLDPQIAPGGHHHAEDVVFEAAVDDRVPRDSAQLEADCGFTKRTPGEEGAVAHGIHAGVVVSCGRAERAVLDRRRRLDALHEARVRTERALDVETGENRRLVFRSVEYEHGLALAVDLAGSGSLERTNRDSSSDEVDFVLQVGPGRERDDVTIRRGPDRLLNRREVSRPIWVHEDLCRVRLRSYESRSRHD